MSRTVFSAAVWLSWVWVLLGYPSGAIATQGLPCSASGASDATQPPDDAGAELPTDQVMPVIGVAAGDDYGQGQALAWALRRALDTSIEWKSMPGEYSFDGLISTMGCSKTPDAACLARIAKKANLAHFIWGALKVVKGQVKASLALYDGDTATVSTQLEYSAKMTDTFDEDLLRLSSFALGKLLGPLHYSVIIHSREQTGEVFVDEVSVGRLSHGVANVSATVGDHRIRLVLPDATTIARSFQVRVERVTPVRLDFIDVPEG